MDLALSLSFLEVDLAFLRSKQLSLNFRLGVYQRTWLNVFYTLEVRQGCGPSVIRLTSFLWEWFQCICPLMPSCNTCHLTWVSLTLDVGYHFTAAPAKRSCCSLPWMRGISSLPPLFSKSWYILDEGHVIFALFSYVIKCSLKYRAFNFWFWIWCNNIYIIIKIKIVEPRSVDIY